MRTIEKSLRYLKESLLHYLDEDDDRYNETCEQLLKRLKETEYKSEDQFLNDLEEEETEFLNNLLESEINYAHQAQDEVRLKELNDIYELLF